MATREYLVKIQPGERVGFEGDIWKVTNIIINIERELEYVLDSGDKTAIVGDVSKLEIYRDYDVSVLDDLYNYHHNYVDSEYYEYKPNLVKKIIKEELNEEGFKKLTKTPSLLKETCGDIIKDFYLSIDYDPEFGDREIRVEVILDPHTTENRYKIWGAGEKLDIKNEFKITTPTIIRSG